MLSCVCTGKGLDLVRLFYSLLPQRHRWVEAQAQAAEVGGDKQARPELRLAELCVGSV